MARHLQNKGSSHNTLNTKASPVKGSKEETRSSAPQKKPDGKSNAKELHNVAQESGGKEISLVNLK